MQKRRERIEKWRQERKAAQAAQPIQITMPSKKWSLEDDDDDEEPSSTSNSANPNDDEVDPLDAFMAVCSMFCSLIHIHDHVGFLIYKNMPRIFLQSYQSPYKHTSTFDIAGLLMDNSYALSNSQFLFSSDCQ